jgi:hypothetical protein
LASVAEREDAMLKGLVHESLETTHTYVEVV